MKNILTKSRITKCSVAVLGLFVVTMIPGSLSVGDKIITNISEACASDREREFIRRCHEICAESYEQGSDSYRACVGGCMESYPTLPRA